MSVAAGALALGRRMAESLMTDTVSVGVWTVTQDPVTLDDVRTLAASHYVGIGQIKYPTLAVSERVPASQQVAAVDVVLKVPAGLGADIRERDEVLVTASLNDPSLVGRRFRVKAWPQSGAVTAHRYPLEELS